MSEPNAVEETVTAPKNVKHVESSPFDLFKPKPEKKKDDAASDDKEDEKKPATIFDVFKPKTDDDNDEKKDDGKSKKKDDKKSDLKPSFPNDPLNLKKTIDDAAQAMKEQGVGGLITSVQKNVEIFLNKYLYVQENLSENEIADLFWLYVLSVYQIVLSLPSVVVLTAIIKSIKSAIVAAFPPLAQKITDIAEAPELARLKKKELHELIGLYIESLIKIVIALPGIVFFKVNNAKIKENFEKTFPPLFPIGKH